MEFYGNRSFIKCLPEPATLLCLEAEEFLNVTCNSHRETETHTQLHSEKLKGRDYLTDLAVDGRTIKLILKSRVVCIEMNWIRIQYNSSCYG
jgi:hypothetical protein